MMPNLLLKLPLLSIWLQNYSELLYFCHELMEMLPLNCQSNNMSTIKSYPLSLLVVFVICVLSLAPLGSIEVGVDVPLADKWVHFLMYGSLTCVIWWEFWKQHSEANKVWLSVYGFLLPVALGGLLELLQANATTYRSGDWLDFTANSIGVGLGVLLGLVMIRPWWLSHHSSKA